MSLRLSAIFYYNIGKTEKLCAWLLSVVESFLSISFTVPYYKITF